jgi:hypothetical protein
MSADSKWEDTAWRGANPDVFHGSAIQDTAEVRALRVRARAQARNLLNAIENGAYPHALTLRAGQAAEAVRNLAETQIDQYKERLKP